MTLINPNGQEIASDVTSITERQLKKQMAHNATIRDVIDLSHQVAVQAMNHLGNQIPALVAEKIAEAFAAYAEIQQARDAELLARIEKLEQALAKPERTDG
jgi:S-methylmethionine-dependent homocysteine/selenocysteine methylase